MVRFETARAPYTLAPSRWPERLLRGGSNDHPLAGGQARHLPHVVRVPNDDRASVLEPQGVPAMRDAGWVRRAILVGQDFCGYSASRHRTLSKLRMQEKTGLGGVGHHRREEERPLLRGHRVRGIHGALRWR